MIETYKSGYPGGLTLLMSLYYRDSPELFRSAVNSVFENDVIPDKFILVIDGDIGKTLDLVVGEILDIYPIHIIRLDKNYGLAYALNIGLAAATTGWIARADADDINLPGRFSAQLPFALEGYDVIGGWIEEVDGDGHHIAFRRPPISHNEIIGFAKYRSPFNHMTVVYKVSSVKSVGCYPNLFLKEDYGLWGLMIGHGYKFINLPAVLVKASAGIEMYKRRGGLRYVQSEYALQIFLYKAGIKNFPNAVGLFFIRTFVFLMPSTLRGNFYMLFLRTSLRHNKKFTRISDD
jgi:glycosyltransferase involved in cell wall biosynthesis